MISLKIEESSERLLPRVQELLNHR
jgi:hypothetical protein